MVRARSATVSPGDRSAHRTSAGRGPGSTHSRPAHHRCRRLPLVLLRSPGAHPSRPCDRHRAGARSRVPRGRAQQRDAPGARLSSRSVPARSSPPTPGGAPRDPGADRGKRVVPPERRSAPCPDGDTADMGQHRPMRSKDSSHEVTRRSGRVRSVGAGGAAGAARLVMWAAIGASITLLGVLLALGWEEAAWSTAAGLLVLACLGVCIWSGLQARGTERDVRQAVARMTAARHGGARAGSPESGGNDGR